MDIETAKELVLNHVNAGYSVADDELAIVDDATIEKGFGWVFFYNSKRYLETKSIRYMLGGNAPIIVSRIDGSLHETGTAEPIEYYIDKFEKHGTCD